MFVNFSLGITRESFQLSNRFWVEQSSYSAMLNIAEPVPTIPELEDVIELILVWPAFRSSNSAGNSWIG
jgi:hypothetical protein